MLKLDGGGGHEVTPASPGQRAKIQSQTGAAKSAGRAARTAQTRAKILKHKGAEGIAKPQDYGTGQYHPARVEWVKVASTYRQKSGKNLFAQPDMRHALAQYNIVAPNSDPPGSETRRELARLAKPTSTLTADQARAEIKAAMDAFHAQGNHTSLGGLAHTALGGFQAATSPLYQPALDAIGGGLAYAVDRARNPGPSAAPPIVQTAREVNRAATNVQAVHDATAMKAPGVPKLHVKLDLSYLDPSGQAAYAAALGDKKAQHAVDTLRKHNQLRDFLRPADRNALRRQAKLNGWDANKIANADDADLINLGFNLHKSAGDRFLQGAAGDLGGLVGFIPGLIGGIGGAAAQSAQQGSATPALQFAQQAFVDPVVHTFQHPVGSFLDHPLNTATILSGGLRTGGAILGKGLRLSPGDVRTATLAGARTTGSEPLQIPLGPKSGNAVIRAAQIAQEYRLGHSKAAADKHLAKQAVASDKRLQYSAVRVSAKQQHDLAIATKKLSPNELIALNEIVNRGTNPVALEAQFRRMAAEAHAKGNDANGAMLQQKADLIRSVAKDYARITTGSKRKQAQAVVDARRALEPAVNQGLAAVGVDPNSLGNEVALGNKQAIDFATGAEHGNAMADVQKAQDAATASAASAKQEIGALKKQRNDQMRHAVTAAQHGKSAPVRSAARSVVEANRTYKMAESAAAKAELRASRTPDNPALAAAADRATRVRDRALEKLTAAHDVLATRISADKSAPIADKAAARKSAELTRQIATNEAAIKGRRSGEPIPVPKDASPAVRAHIEHRNAVIEAKAAVATRVEAARQGVIDQIMRDNPNAGHVFIPQTISDRLAGAHGARTMLTPTAESVFAGRQLSRTDTLYNTGQHNMHPRLVDQAINQALLGHGLIDARIQTLEKYGRDPGVGTSFDPTAEAPVQAGGLKNVVNRTVNPREINAIRTAQQTADSLGIQFDAQTQAAMILTRMDLQAMIDSGEITRNADNSMTVNSPNIRLVPRALVDGIEMRAGGRTLHIGGLKNEAARMAGPQSATIARVSRVSRVMRRSMLGSAPSTALHNIVSAPMLANVNPAIFGRATLELFKSERRGGTGIAPDYALGKGRAGSMGSKLTQSDIARTGKMRVKRGSPVDRIGRPQIVHDTKIPVAIKIGKVQFAPFKWAAGVSDIIMSLNTLSEDMARNAVALDRAMKIARTDKAAVPRVERLASHFGVIMPALARVLKDLEDPHSTLGAKHWDYLARQVESMTGDMTRQTSFDTALGNTILFHRWVEHMVKLTLWTMPIHHPYAAFFVQQVAAQGQEYARDHGIMPPWLRDSVVIGAFLRPIVGNRPELGMLKWSSGASNIWGTAAGVAPLDQNGQTTPGAALSAIYGIIQPQYQAAFEAATGNSLDAQAQGRQLRDRNGLPLAPHSVDSLRAALSTLIQANPLVSDVHPMSQLSPESLPGSSYPKYNANGPDMNSTTTRQISPFTGSQGAALDALMRFLGVGLTPADVQGPVTDASLAKQFHAGKKNLVAQIKAKEARG